MGRHSIGTFSVAVELANIRSARRQTLQALVETGSSYSFVPRPVLESLDIEVAGQRPFRLAENTRVFYDIVWAVIWVGKFEAPTIVLFGDAGAAPLLGGHALEGLGLAPDPVNQRLVPVDALPK